MPNYPLASSETELNIGATRYSSPDFPPYRYVPGLHPHPTNSPEGHSYGEEDEEHRNGTLNYGRTIRNICLE